jgi:uncharacterized membrane protein SpoIIM required for sporulation
MNINEFVSERKGEWEKLEAIATKIGAGQGVRITREELWDLGRLYAAAVADLSLLKSSPLAHDADNQVLTYLNSLVIRVHGTIYGKPHFRWSSVLRFILVGGPEAFRQNQVYVAVSASILYLSGLAGFALGLHQPGFIELLVPEGIISQVESGKVWFNDLYAVAPMASSGLMTHNISVTFLAFAAGITFGVGTVYLLALNGLLLGAVGALCYQHGLSLELWAFVIPHGSFELSAVFIAGAAGLVIGHALIDPGPYVRTEFLAVRSKQAVKLVLGCVPLLVIAGIIEAFFSPSPLPPWFKIVVGGHLFLLLMALLFLSGTGLRERGAGEEPRKTLT